MKFNNGINQFSGLWDIALDANLIITESKGWYKFVDADGVLSEKQARRKDMESSSFWNAMLKNPLLLEHIRKEYKANSDGAILQFEDPDADEDHI